MKTDKPRLCVMGSMLGGKSGYVTTQEQIVADLLVKDGYEVVTISSKINRILRLTDVVWTIFRNRKTVDILMLSVFSGLGFLLADVASLVSTLFRIPTVFVLHGGNLPEFTRRYPNWVKRVLKRADILVAPSTFIAEGMGHLGFRLRIIPNVIELDAYPHKVRHKISPKLIWMRSFHPIYNPQMALDAFAALRRENPAATLVMAGADKGMENEIKNSASRMGLQDSVRFPGFLDKTAKIKEFSEADVYLNSNRIDNMPVSVVEACAMGLPVIATDVGGISNLLTDGENGLLVPDGDADEMAKAVTTLLNDPDLTTRLSKNGRLLAEKSSWLTVRSQWRDLFIELAVKNDDLTES